jgi:hypothetical protein
MVLLRELSRRIGYAAGTFWTKGNIAGTGKGEGDGDGVRNYGAEECDGIPEPAGRIGYGGVTCSVIGNITGTGVGGGRWCGKVLRGEGNLDHHGTWRREQVMARWSMLGQGSARAETICAQTD